MTTAVLFFVAVANLISKRIATISGVAFMIVLLIVLFIVLIITPIALVFSVSYFNR